MTPKEIDQVSVKLTLMASSLLVGYFVSALWVNSFTDFFRGSLLYGLPYSLVLALPIAVYSVVQIMLDSLVFDVRLKAISIEEKIRLSAVNNLESLKTDVSGLLERGNLIKGIDTYKNRLSDKLSELNNYIKDLKEDNKKSSRRLRKLRRDVEKDKSDWYDRPVHFYAAWLVARFVFWSFVFGLSLKANDALLFILATSWFLVGSSSLIAIGIVISSLRAMLKGSKIKIMAWDISRSCRLADRSISEYQSRQETSK